MKNKMFIVSLIMALVLASVSAFSVFAAPSTKSSSSRIFGAQLRDLNNDRVWLSNFKADRNNFVNAAKPLKLQQYLNQFASDLAQASAIVASRGTVVATSQSTNAQVNSINNLDNSTEAKLAALLHDMRELREKLTSDTHGMDRG